MLRLAAASCRASHIGIELEGFGRIRYWAVFSAGF